MYEPPDTTKNKEAIIEFTKKIKASLNYNHTSTKTYRAKSRRRTFKGYENRLNWMIEDVVTMQVANNCSVCTMANPSSNEGEVRTK